jgi:hypothetical protein
MAVFTLKVQNQQILCLNSSIAGSLNFECKSTEYYVTLNCMVRTQLRTHSHSHACLPVRGNDFYEMKGKNFSSAETYTPVEKWDSHCFYPQHSCGTGCHFCLPMNV